MTDIYRTVTYMYTILHDDQPTTMVIYRRENKLNGKTLIYRTIQLSNRDKTTDQLNWSAPVEW